MDRGEGVSNYRGIAEELQKTPQTASECGLWRTRGILPMQTSKTPSFRPSFIYLRPVRGLIQWPETAHYSLTESDTYVIELQKISPTGMEGIRWS